ncbi:cytochrome c biogenesis protein CcsA [Chloroflexota bacterium]
MASLETASFMAAIIGLGLSIVFGLWHFIVHEGLLTKKYGRVQKMAATLSLVAAASGLVFLTLSIAARATITGHGPFSNMYEFSIAFSWGTVAMSLLFWWRYKTFAPSVFGFVIALVLLLFAYTLPSRPVPLVPALQQGILLSSHVAAAVVAYGAFAIGFGAAVLYLLQVCRPVSWLPGLDILDKLSYQTTIVGFFFMTLVIVLGALWADIAWGRYWGWDPKETASLVTWLLYASYLHARIMRGCRGTKTAILLVVGFLAVLLTYFGNYFFEGLHGYR